MRFKTEAKVLPELVASKDESRPALTKVHLDAEKGQVVVTDSYMLARFPVEVEESDTSGPIPIDALKASRKPPSKYGDVSIGVNGTAEVTQDGRAYMTLPRQEMDYTFPDCDRLMPEGPFEMEIGLDAERLLALAKAIGATGRGKFVRLRITSPLKPIVVEAAYRQEGDPDGILMPSRLR